MPPKKSTPPGKILNPATNRYVKIDGKVGKAVLAAQLAKKLENVVIDKRKQLLEYLQTKCNNDIEPISLEPFADMSEQELESLVFIGNGAKKNCYLLENIYEIYKRAVETNKQARDPMDSNHVISPAEIAMINAKMKKQNAAYSPPKFVPPPPPKYKLEIELSAVYQNYFTIKVTRQNGSVKHDLGFVPGWVEGHHTGSVDYTSGVLLVNIRQLWDQGRLLENLSLFKKTFGYWQGHTWKNKFITLCQQVSERMDA